MKSDCRTIETFPGELKKQRDLLRDKAGQDESLGQTDIVKLALGNRTFITMEFF